MPTELDEIQRKIMQLEIERQALKRRKTKYPGQAFDFGKEISSFKEKSDRMKAQWEMEKENIKREKS